MVVDDGEHSSSMICACALLTHTHSSPTTTTTQNAHHAGRLEWIVIWLIVIEVLVGLLEVAGLFGFIGHH